MASGKYRRQWHEHFPLAGFTGLNYSTTYHLSIGYDRNKIFDGRIPYKDVDHKLGTNPNKEVLPTTEFAEELQQKTQVLIDRTKKNMMQTHL